MYTGSMSEIAKANEEQQPYNTSEIAFESNKSESEKENPP